MGYGQHFNLGMVLAMDSDTVGREVVSKAKVMKDHKVWISAPENKDWNDDPKNVLGKLIGLRYCKKKQKKIYK